MKRALVTGGARGIGAAISQKLAALGYYVYINCRSVSEAAETLCSTIRDAGGECELLLFDITQKESFTQSLTFDIVVNNAGILKDNLIPSIETTDWNAIIETNFWGAVNLYSHLEETESFAQDAVIINMGSISGVKPRAGQGAYAVSKAMIIDWTKEIARKETKRTFYAVSPGPVATDMIKKAPWYTNPKAFSRIPMKRFADPEEIADLIGFLVEEKPMKSGENIIIDGGFTQTAKEG